MDAPRERGKGSFCGHSCSFPTRTAVSFSPLCYLSHYHETPSCISCVSQDSPQSRLLEQGQVFVKAGLRVAQNECLAPVTMSQQAQTRGLRCPLLLRWRLSPPTPDSTACQHLKSPFCLCHFISKTSFRPEESFSNRLIPQTMGRELLNSGSSQPLRDFLEM